MVRMALRALASLVVLAAAALAASALGFSLRFVLLLPEAAQWAVGSPAVGLLYALTDPVLFQAGASTPLAWPPEITADFALPLIVSVLALLLAVGMTLAAAHLYRIAEHRPPPRPKLVARGPGVSAPPGPMRVPAQAPTPPATPKPRSVAPPPPQPVVEPTVAYRPAQPSRPSPSAEETVLNVAASRQMIGRYEVISELGRGAMGIVYKARDPAIDRLVAMKTYIAGADGADDEFRYRFEREARAAGKMSHPGVVTVHDLVKDDSGQPHIVMEFVDGTTLTRLLAEQRLAFEQAVDIGIELAQALDYAHTQGLVHRDIKPDNIIIARDGRAKIMDFGIARMGGADLTQAGQILGTPSFMAPEQFRSSRVDGRADLFSLGSTLYFVFTGEKPFKGSSMVEVAHAITTAEPRPPSVARAHLPPAIDAILKKCLEKNPEDRYQTARELAAALKALAAGRV
jgi:tRNA A-37 threonylcarbamoyl transferase component Bud32